MRQGFVTRGPSDIQCQPFLCQFGKHSTVAIHAVGCAPVLWTQLFGGHLAIVGTRHADGCPVKITMGEMQAINLRSV